MITENEGMRKKKCRQQDNFCLHLCGAATFFIMCTSKRQPMPRAALYDAVQIAARKETLEIGCACFCNDRARFSGGPGDVRRDVEVLKADEWVALARRFAVYNIDGDGSQFAALERVGHVIFV